MTKKRILCFGDSNTWGFIPGTGERYPDDVRWTGVVRNLLGDGYTILEDGISGRTTVYDQEWAVGRNGRKALDYTLQAQKPIDLIIIMLGTNDLSMMELGKVELGIHEIARVAKNADSIINVKTPVYPNGPKVLLMAPPNLNVNYDEQTGQIGKYEDSLKFPEVCERVAKDLGLYYMDASKYAEVGTIDCHMTEKGHRQLGEAVAARVKEIFEEM
ncbi:MAG: GDSL-type esterase/lipase family protein [Eubacteriales bacterium]|nr:GDSL-type esterase/lipase family protein [Eubacteriales bacterium]